MRCYLVPFLHRPPAGPPPVLVLAGEPQSARAARVFVAEYLAHHVPEATEEHVNTVVLVACELAGDAIRYGTEPGDSFRVVIGADDRRTRVEVHGAVRRRPRRRPRSEARSRGRGLLVLDALREGKWGVEDIPLGKAVWADVPR
ncbi:ATP-binding protein [Streptomyces koyangensis]|uniref:ATP-binding protein n=1 Tax=Streptomyces koyangensis TaxID=188770 RepID=UPI003C2EB8EA